MFAFGIVSLGASRWPPQIVIRYTAQGRPLVWREAIPVISPTLSLSTPATAAQIANVEQSLRCELPSELRSLLTETNGVHGEYSLSLVWDCHRIAADNIDFRSHAGFAELYMPFDHLLFFGDAGNGDQFAFPILAGEVRNPDVFVWNHEDDSRNWVAPSLRKYLEWWTSGKIQL